VNWNKRRRKYKKNVPERNRDTEREEQDLFMRGEENHNIIKKTVVR
jgi:hypothetical protein